MLNKNHVAQIRTCERVKFDQALYILTMYEKKIRNPVQFEDGKSLDADKEYDQKIIRSWNGKWKVDLTKPVLNCVTSVSPRVILDVGEEQNQMQEETEYDKYNQTMLQFIRRMRAEHEDQSNFKITQVNLSQIQQISNKFLVYASKACKHYLSAISSMCQAMKSQIQKNGANCQLQEQDEEDNFCFQIGTRIEDMLQIVKNTQQNFVNKDLFKFITSCMSIFDNIKQSEHGSTMLAVQPKLNEFTYMLHPLFIPIYAHLLKEKDESKSRMENRQHKQHKQAKENDQYKFPFKNFFSSNTTNQSKIVFLNLDGYQSEFNLQFSRCFRKNMLYISFPKQDIHSANDMNSIYEQRLYKKIMYNWQKNKMKWDSSNTSMDYESMNADRTYFITHNIQNYFTCVENVLYRNENSCEDLNRNMFIFPLRLKTMNQNFNNLITQEEDDTIEVYESHAILQIFKYFLINQIKQFGPTFIVISHSGRLHIQDSHFIQILQQLTKLSHYKLIYFPNLTTRLCPQDKRWIDHEMNIQNIDFLHRSHDEFGQIKQQNDQSNINYQFFNKVARFLKVSSGTHSLIKNLQQQDLLTKYRNFNVLRRVNRLMEVLGNQYQNIQRIRFKSSQIDLIPKLYEKDAQKIMKAFQKLVPLFYIELYQLLESIISVVLIPQEKRVINQLSKYNIDPQLIRRNHVICDLISFIKNKIVVRNVRSENDRQQSLLEKIKKYINCQKEKHFLQISEEKYEDSILIHFKLAPNYTLYDSVLQGKPLFSGLIDISFSNPNKDVKDSLHIFDSTQILYRIDQCNCIGLVPILIMNHLPLQKKSISKFDNYCAFLNREALEKIATLKTVEQGIEKIYEQKKIKPYIIKFFDEENRQIIENRFQFRTEWNFIETENYMILYWPMMFNFIEAISHKLQGKVYEPNILNQFFIGKKQVKDDAVCFFKANIPNDIPPRTGCSAYEFKNYIYIFGGFYEKSLNYLSLQRDVTALNMGLYTHDGHRKLQISNIKDDLYETIKAQNENSKKVNSYVRPRRQYQFYSMQDICKDYEPEIGFRSVIMLGGIGQNFIHPFSLLTYYYYALKFDEQTGKLISIKKQLVYNRSIPSNIRAASKNMGIIKTPIRNKNQTNGKSISTKPQLTQPSSYARFRIVYKKQKDQLKYKFQYIFSQKDCKLLKEELRKYEDEKYEVSQLSIRTQKIQGMNHMFMIQKYGAKQIVHLRLQIDETTNQKQVQYKLTHDSIYYLNIINGNYICAIIKHPIFTNDKSILAQCKVKSVENENLNEDEAPYVSLRPIHSDLNGDLTLHIIEASNINLIYVLHGHRLHDSNKIYQYQITHNRKSGLKSVSQIRPKKPVPQLSEKSVPKCCYSTFFYNKIVAKNEIICETYISFEENRNIIFRVDEYFDPSDFANMRWLLKEPITTYLFFLLNSNTPISLERITFLDFYRHDKTRVIIAQFNRKKYIIKIVENLMKLQSGQIAVYLQPATQLAIRTLDEQQYEKGSILHKNLEQYIDRGYEKIVITNDSMN